MVPKPSNACLKAVFAFLGTSFHPFLAAVNLWISTATEIIKGLYLYIYVLLSERSEKPYKTGDRQGFCLVVLGKKEDQS